MKLYVTRHGETDHNVKKLISGQAEGLLTQKGKEQAQKLAERLKKEKFDYI